MENIIHETCFLLENLNLFNFKVRNIYILIHLQYTNIRKNNQKWL
jgi:hypothetical protein